MSDYLNNLAARALRQQAPVRPRLASLFEPPGGALAPLPAGPSEVEIVSFDETAAGPSTIRPSAPPAAQPAQRATAHETVVSPMAPAPPRPRTFADEEVRRSRESGPTAQVGPSEREARGSDRPHFNPVEREGAAPPPEHPRSRVPQKIEIVRHETRVADAADVRESAAEAPARAEERVRELEERVTSLEASRADERGRQEALGPAPGAVIPVTAQNAPQFLTPSIAPKPAPARAFEPKGEPPHVTVTIGRVDVRAVFPAPAEAARTPAPRTAPTGTLAEYLKQRERGRR